MAARAGAGRRTDATPRPNVGAERVDCQALRGQATRTPTPMDAHVGPERMEKGVVRL
jgi:hypothetical protein